MQFEKLDLNTWERASVYRRFMTDWRCVTDLTVDIDVTGFVQKLKERGLDFYPAMIWAVSAAVNARAELRMGLDAEGAPGVWDVVHPYYAHFFKEDEQFVKVVTEYDPDFSVFYARFQEDAARCKDRRGFPDDVPPNVFDVTCMPWTHYKTFNIHMLNGTNDLAPSVIWGKYQKDGSGRLMMPLTLLLHHAAGDGYHMARFISDTEYYLTQIK